MLFCNLNFVAIFALVDHSKIGTDLTLQKGDVVFNGSIDDMPFFLCLIRGIGLRLAIY
jgi:hypothetical protein